MTRANDDEVTIQKLIQANQCVTNDQINEALQQLKGAVMIVYPMGLPPYDPIDLEFKNQEELEGTQVIHFPLRIIPRAQLRPFRTVSM